jgi:hypothetical protein
MKILCRCKFKHGRDIFEKGDIRTVHQEDGDYFVAQGWAIADDGTTFDQFIGEANISPDDSILGHIGE